MVQPTQDETSSSATQDETTTGAAVLAPSLPSGGGEGVEFSVSEMLDVVPESIHTYLLSDEIGAKRSEVYAKYSLTEDEITIVMQTELEVFFGLLPIGAFPDTLWTRLPWEDKDEEKAKQLTIDMLGKIFLPTQAWVGDVVGVMAELGGDVKAYAQEQLELRELSYADGVKETVDEVSIGPLAEDARKRLNHIIENRLRNVRDDLETEEMLTKSKKTGGMEMPPDDAKKIVEMIQNKMRMSRFVERVEPKGPAGASGQKRIFSAPDVKAIYAGAPEEQKALALRIEELLRDFGKDIEKLRDKLFLAIKPLDLSAPDRLAVVAAVLALAQEGGLLIAFDEDERFKDIIRAYLEEKGRGAEVEEFNADPRDPKFVNLFMQVLLRGYAAIDEANSARMGLRALNMFKKQGKTEYANLVAFNLDEGKFTWLSPEQF